MPTITSRAWRAASAPAMLGLILLIVSIAANVVQLSDVIPIPILLGLLVALFGVLIWGGRTAFRQTLRGNWLLSNLDSLGVADVESRRKMSNRLSPERLFAPSGFDTITISGIMDQLIQNSHENMRSFLEAGGEIRLLLIHPDKIRAHLTDSWIQQTPQNLAYWTTNCNEAGSALDAIIVYGLDSLKGFEIRFMNRLPPYLGTLAQKSRDGHTERKSLMRIQPLTTTNFLGRGLVLTLEKIGDANDSPFEFYASDFRAQWEASLKDPDYIDRRRRELGS